MKAVKILRSLGPVDMRNIGRDSAMSWMLTIPVISALILRWGLPPLNERIIEQYGLDLSPYYPVFLAYFFVVMCPILFGVLVGFLLLDEKDDQTLTALQVTPMSLNSYIAYRIAVPIVLSILLMFVIFPLANLEYLDFQSLLVTSLAAAPMAPMFALYLASLAQNKVQGFALMKMSGLVLFIPIVAFFIDSPWELAFGVVPTYWPMKAYWLLQAGEPNSWPYLLVAVMYQLLITYLLARHLYKKLHQ